MLWRRSSVSPFSNSVSCECIAFFKLMVLLTSRLHSFHVSDSRNRWKAPQSG